MERNIYIFCKYPERESPKPASITIEYQKCRADFTFEVDFGTVATWGDLIFFEK